MSAPAIGPGGTPLVPIALTIGGRERAVELKLEGFNPYGSLKDRTAAGLIADLDRRGLLGPGSILVESTSGNLGIALASIACQRGHRFTAVVDPKATSESVARLRALGARVERVEEADESGCFLAARLARVRELCDRSDAHIWPDQYSNPAGPRAHEQGTGPELLAQLEGDVDAVFVPVSTGGTLAGMARCFRRESPATLIVAVDAAGSAALGGAAGARLLTGIGAGRRSSLVSAELYDLRVVAGDAEAFSCCRELARRTGIRVGGSSGAALAACARTLSIDPDLERVVCLCPDRGETYASTIYSDAWLACNGIDPVASVPGCIGRISPPAQRVAMGS